MEHSSLTILYDRDCGFCSWCRSQVEKNQHDNSQCAFINIKSPEALRIAQNAGHPLDQKNPESFVVIDHRHHWYTQSRAVLEVTKRMRGYWQVLHLVLRITPEFIADWGYRLVSRNRNALNKILGTKTCPID